MPEIIIIRDIDSDGSVFQTIMNAFQEKNVHSIDAVTSLLHVLLKMRERPCSAAFRNAARIMSARCSSTADVKDAEGHSKAPV